MQELDGGGGSGWLYKGVNTTDLLSIDLPSLFPFVDLRALKEENVYEKIKRYRLKPKRIISRGLARHIYRNTSSCESGDSYSYRIRLRLRVQSWKLRTCTLFWRKST